jgi:type VI secretion system protein ImpC
MSEARPQAPKTTTTVEARLEKTELDKILDGVQQGTPAPVSDTAVLMMVTRLLETGEKLQTSVIDDLVATIDQKLSKQVDAVLHHPDFQRLESAWRSLRYIVEQTDFRQGNKMAILDVSKDDLVRDLEDNPDVTKTGYYKHIYADGLGTFGGTPVGTVIANYEFGPGQKDIRLLRKVAAVSSMAHAPFISGTSPQMYGIDSFQELPALRDLKDLFEGAKFAAWRGFREEADARYVGLALPRYLARPVHTRDSVKKFVYDENVSESHEHFLWGNMAFPFATRLTEAFAKNRWCANIIGPNSGGAVKGLPVHVYSDEGAEVMKIPTEVKITLRREYELADSGFIPLTWRENSDNAAFFGANSSKRTKVFPDTPAGRTAATNDMLGTRLPYMFIVCRLAHYIKAIQIENIGKSISRAALEKELQEWVGQYVNPLENLSQLEMARKPLKSAMIGVKDVDGKPGWYEVEMQVTPHFKYEGAYFTLSLVGKMDNTQKK